MPSAGEILPWLEQIDRNRRYTNFGPLVLALERELARLAGARHAVSLSSGTLGLELALATMGIAPGGRVLVPALTFPATATAIKRAGLTPVFGDIDEKVLALTSDMARGAASGGRVDAVLTAALHGYVHDALAWDAFTAETGIPVLIDAAGVAGYQKVGRTTSAVFSLHATKPLAAGEGGFFATARDEFASRVRTGSNFGFENGEVIHPGTNAKLSEYHAAVGLAALSAWPARKARRLALYQAYAAALDRPELRSVVTLATQSSASPNLCVRLHRGVDNRSIGLLAESGIETRRWYWPPLHRHPGFADLPRIGELEVTDALANQLLGLPFHLELKPDDPARVSDVLAGIAK